MQKDVHQLKTAEGNRASGKQIRLATGVESSGDFCACAFPGGNVLFRLKSPSPDEVNFLHRLLLTLTPEQSATLLEGGK